MQNDMCTSLSKLQHHYSKRLKATQIVIDKGLVKGNGGSVTMQIKKTRFLCTVFCELYEEKARQRSVYII